jgi:5'-nucleotidase
LHDALRAAGEITVVAPERDRSGASNSLTLDRPLTVRRAPTGSSTSTARRPTASTSRSPAFSTAADIIVSGINLGANMGDDTIYSGTVAAATEGYLLGIPAVAISLASKAGAHFETRRGVAGDIVERSSARAIRPVAAQRQCPDLPLERDCRHRGHAAGQAAQGRAVSQGNEPARRDDLLGRRARARHRQRRGTDFGAVAANRVSVTPLQIDLTHYDEQAAVHSWLIRTTAARAAIRDCG